MAAKCQPGERAGISARSEIRHVITPLVNLGNWRLHFFNNDPIRLIPACPRISICVSSTATVSNAETHAYFPGSNPTTIALYVSGSMNVQVEILVQGTINWGRIAALYIVKREEPSLAAGCTTSYPKITHVNHSKV